MVKRTLIIILSLVILSQLVLAIPTDIKVKTLPYNEVIVTITKNGQVLERYAATSNYFGDASFKYSSSSRTFDMYVQVRNLKETLYFESYPETEAGDPVMVDLYPADFVFPEQISRENKTVAAAPITGEVIADSNVTASSENITTPVIEEVPAEVVPPKVEEVPQENSGVNTFAVSSGDGTVSLSLKTLYYIIGGVILLIIIIFIIRAIVKRRRDNPYYSYRPSKSEVKVRKMSELMEERGSFDAPSREFVKAEKKLHEAEAEISKMRNQDKIESIRKTIDAQQRELRRLQKGY